MAKPRQQNSSTGSGNGAGRPGSKSGSGNGAGRPGSKPALGNGGGKPGNSRSGQQLQKAYLASQIDPVNTIEFMFNPTDLQFSRTVDIQTQSGAVTSKGLPKVVFGHVAPYELSLSGIVFDTFEKGTSVINEIQPLLDAVDFTKFNGAAGGASNSPAGGRSNPTAGGQSNRTAGGRGNRTAGGQSNSQADSKKRQRPPVYYFMWGQQNYVQCMVKSLTCKLTMFLSDGTPVRAIVDISLQQVDLGTVSTILS
jgi:hypothetical protein